MGCGADRITHVMQTIEHCNQVVVLTWKGFGLRDTKVEANLETFFNGSCAGALDGFVVIVKAEEFRFWEVFSHPHGGRTLSATHIGDARASLELGLYAVQGRNPRTDKVCCIARPEEFLAAMKHTFIMLIPAHACAGSEGLGNPGNCGQRAEGQLEGAGKISGTVFVRQRKCLLFAQTEFASLLVIGDVAAGSL